MYSHIREEQRHRVRIVAHLTHPARGERELELGLGANQPLLGLVEVNDVPDSGEIVELDVLVLEIEGVLPDVNADEGDVRKKRILVGGSRDFQHTVLGVESLQV